MGAAVALEEQFQEDLIIRPLRDGRVVSKFSFTTLLKGALPRNPENLGLEDDCE
jgi:phosphatidylinositol glycan class T